MTGISDSDGLRNMRLRIPAKEVWEVHWGGVLLQKGVTLRLAGAQVGMCSRGGGEAVARL